MHEAAHSNEDVARQHEALRTRLNPQRLRRHMERQGPTFIKLGQFLALRPDLIDQAYCDELLHLVDDVEPFAWADAYRIMTAELGDERLKEFAWINPRPVAAAALAQVHFARTRDGRELAIKVQREGIAQRVRRDLRRARWLLRLLETAGFLGGISVGDLLGEIERWMFIELDYANELSNLQRIYDLCSADRTVRIPRPYPDLSSGRVLTTEYFRGVSFTELLRLVRGGRQDKIASLGLDADELGRGLIQALLTQIFRYNFFHADTHPGNLMALPGNVVGFVGFGLMETQDETIREEQAHYVSALYTGDTRRMFKALTEILVPGSRANAEGLHADFFEQSRLWARESVSVDDSRAEQHSAVTDYMIGVMRAARTNDYRIPPAALAMYRTLLTAEKVATELGSREGLRSVGVEFFKRLKIEHALSLFSPESLQSFVFDIIDMLHHAPGRLDRLLSDIATNRLQLRVRTSESEDDRRQGNGRAKLLTAATVSVGIALLISSVGDTVLLGQLTLSKILSGVLVALYAYILVLWRQLR